MIDMDLVSDELSEEMCVPECRKCLDACPRQALGEGPVRQKFCRPHTYGTNARGFEVVNCNTCRTVCPVRFGRG